MIGVVVGGAVLGGATIVTVAVARERKRFDAEFAALLGIVRDHKCKSGVLADLLGIDHNRAKSLVRFGLAKGVLMLTKGDDGTAYVALRSRMEPKTADGGAA